MNIGVMRIDLPQYLSIYFNLFLQLNFGAGDIRFLVYTLFLQIATAREYAAAEPADRESARKLRAAQSGEHDHAAGAQHAAR